MITAAYYPLPCLQGGSGASFGEGRLQLRPNQPFRTCFPKKDVLNPLMAATPRVSAGSSVVVAVVLSIRCMVLAGYLSCLSGPVVCWCFDFKHE